MKFAELLCFCLLLSAGLAASAKAVDPVQQGRELHTGVRYSLVLDAIALVKTEGDRATDFDDCDPSVDGKALIIHDSRQTLNAVCQGMGPEPAIVFDGCTDLDAGVAHVAIEDTLDDREMCLIGHEMLHLLCGHWHPGKSVTCE